jgi:exodeoxyribonuclease V alpha subunit
MSLPPTEAPVVLEGRVVRVLFRDTDSLMTGVRVRPLAGGPPETVIGEFLDVADGEEFLFTGHWERHPKYGPQLRLLHAQKQLPREPAAIAAYLAGGLFPGVGKGTARRIVGVFGAETLDVLFQDPEQLVRVPRLGAKKRAKLLEAFREHRHIQELALFLQGHGVSLFLTKKIHRQYGSEAMAIVRDDPYRVADEIPGIGFVRADSIARKIGLPADSPARVRAAARFVLKDRCEVRGHSYLPSGELVRESLSFLNREMQGASPTAAGAGVAAAAVTAAIAELVAAGHLVRAAGEAIYLREAYEAEVTLAERLAALWRSAPEVAAELEEVLAATGEAAGIVYAEEQHAAIRAALTAAIAVVTGGPGTGKSTVVRGVAAAFRQLHPDAEVLLAAPTGRAAKRLSEVTGLGAKTIHRLLEFSPETAQFVRDEASPLDGGLLVVDEASMVDLYLASALLRAVPAGMRVLLVGDADQLPSVGLGNVFADIIASATVPVVRLRHIFRQALESRIVVNAHHVNAGRLPEFAAAADWEFVPVADAAAAAGYVRQTAVELRAAGQTLDSFHVLTPMRKSAVGTLALNALLQEALNPAAPERGEMVAGATIFRVGDKVMQLRNNYGKDVYNGDVGIIAALARPAPNAADDDEEEDEEEQLFVDFDGRLVPYAQHELDQLTLAYASTVHKAQGSEFKGIVLLPVVREHHIMLQRNLLYTAITRARDRVVIVGHRDAIWRAVTNAGSRQRYSRLAERLRRLGRTREP